MKVQTKDAPTKKLKKSIKKKESAAQSKVKYLVLKQSNKKSKHFKIFLNTLLNYIQIFKLISKINLR